MQVSLTYITDKPTPSFLKIFPSFQYMSSQSTYNTAMFLYKR